MLKGQGWLAVLLVTMSATPLTAAESFVGDYRLVIRGASAFSSDQIAQELATDIEIAHVASREAPVGKLEDLLINKATQGYLADGFADVAIDADHQDDRLVLRIEEGPQFTAGPIQITGTNAIDAAALHDFWVQGKPARLSALQVKQLQKRISSLIEKHGYYDARFSLDLPLNRNDRTANLLIHVVELGDPLRARALEIAGDERLTRAMVLDFLELSEDTVLTKEEQNRIEEALRDSGRFLSVKLAGIMSDAATGPARPRITVKPYDKAPPLNAPLSREQAALVKFAVWVRSFKERGDELTFNGKFDTIACQAIGSPRFGTLGWVRGLPFGKQLVEAAPAFDLAFVESEDEVGIYSFRRQRRLTARPVPARFETKLELILSDDPPQLNGTSKITTGAGLKSYSKRDMRHCVFRLKQTAAGALALAYRDDAVFNWEGDLLMITLDTLRFVIDSRTGRLIKQYDTSSGAIELAPMPAEQDEFNRQLEAIQTAGRHFRNDADGARPLSCVVEYLTDELDFWDATGQWAELTGALRKILTKGAMARVDEWLAALDRDADDEFFIPVDIVAVESIRDAAGLAKLFACQWGIETGDRLAPRESWLWTLWREAMFLAAQMPSRLDDPIEYLTASKAGPTECWLVAKLLENIARDVEARACAKIGLERISTVAFRREYEALLRNGYWSGDFSRHVARMLRELTTEEATALASGAMISGLGNEALLASIASLSAFSTDHRDEPLADVVPQALDLLWDDCLSQRLKDALAKLAERPMSRAELQALIDHVDVSLPKPGQEEPGAD